MIAIEEKNLPQVLWELDQMKMLNEYEQSHQSAQSSGETGTYTQSNPMSNRFNTTRDLAQNQQQRSQATNAKDAKD